MATVGAVFSVISAGVANKERKRANKEQREAQRTERRAAQVESVRRSRRAIAARRVQQAELISQSQVNGQTGTNSAVSGAVGSLSTQTAANIGAANTQLAANLNQSRSLSRSSQALASARTIEAFGTAAQNVGNAADGYVKGLKRFYKT